MFERSLSVTQPALNLNVASSEPRVGNVPFHLNLFIDGRNVIIISAAAFHKTYMSEPSVSVQHLSNTSQRVWAGS